MQHLLKRLIAFALRPSMPLFQMYEHDQRGYVQQLQGRYLQGVL